jgi:hypothetical protein
VSARLCYERCLSTTLKRYIWGRPYPLISMVSGAVKTS